MIVVTSPLPLLALRLANPVTPWLVLALCVAGWLLVYLFVTSERDG